jgi:AcrR family transcriptional regulator
VHVPGQAAHAEPRAAASVPGRPRSSHADAAILAAAIDLLIERGFEGMSIAQIAERAGVGKPTIYRRWSSKTEVVIAALAQLWEPPSVPDTGSTAGDLLALVRMRLQQIERSGRHLLFPRLAAELRTNPQLRDPFIKNVVGPTRDRLRIIFERGVERAELRADLDPGLAIDLLGGPFMFRLIMGEEVTQIIADAPAVIEAMIKGIGR